MAKSLTTYYRRFYFHRTVITEGIRLTVRRNNSHMYRIQSALGSSLIPGRIGLNQVLDQILADQGVARNRINRGVLPLATWIPWEVYLCLLSAEVGAYRQASKVGQVPPMDEFDDFLKSNSDAIAAIERLRNRVLHPESGRQSGQSYPYFIGELIGVYFRHFDAIVKTQYWVDTHLRHVRTQLCASRNDPDAAFPLPPIDDWYDRGGIHTPMPSKIVWPCMQAMTDLPHPSHTDAARANSILSVYEKIGYLTMLIRFSVLINETIHQAFFMVPEDEGDQQADRMSAPMRVGTALLYPRLIDMHEFRRHMQT